MPTPQYVARVLPVFGSTLGQIFQPLYQAMAWVLAACYALVPNYAVAIAVLTFLAVTVSAPLVYRTIRSALAMQMLRPEITKLQQKYKNDRTRLHESTLALYREHGVNPLSSFLPALLQAPLFVVLYGVIRGLTHTVDEGRVAAPLYVPRSTHLAHSLYVDPGHLQAFGFNLASSLLGSHGSWLACAPFGVLVLCAAGLQWLQTRRMNRRGSGASSLQSRALQWVIPLVLAIVYLHFPAGLLIYVVVSTSCRVAIQEIALRKEPTDRRPHRSEVIPARPRILPRFGFPKPKGVD